MNFFKGFISDFIKLAPVTKMLAILITIAVISALVARSNLAIQFIPVILLGCSIKKTWFISFVQFLTSSKDEDVVKACGKKISDWLLAFSAAAIIPFLFIALTENDFIQNKNDAVFTSAFIVLMAGFSAIRITKHFSEGIRRINTRDDLRDIIRREFGDVKFKYDELPNEQVKQILQEYNVNPSIQAELHEYLKPILQKYGLFVNFWLPRGSFWLMVSCFGCIQSSRPQHIISAGTVMFTLNADQLRADQFGKVVFYAGNAA